MKNKEIEELLNELKEYASGGMSGLYPSEDTVKNFVSYIEQLENNRDKALEYIEKHNFMGDWGSCVFGEANLVDILKGDSE